MSRFVLPLFLVACAPGSATLGPAPGGTDTTTDTTGGDTTGDTEDTEETEPEEEEEPPFAYLGDYEGEMPVFAKSSWGDWEMGFCLVFVSVDELGEMTGESECEISLGWGDPQESTFTLAGLVTEDGEVSGEMPLEFEGGGGGDYMMTIEGDAEENGMYLEFVSEFEQGGGDFSIAGEADLTRIQ